MRGIVKLNTLHQQYNPIHAYEMYTHCSDFSGTVGVKLFPGLASPTLNASAMHIVQYV